MTDEAAARQLVAPWLARLDRLAAWLDDGHLASHDKALAAARRCHLLAGQVLSELAAGRQPLPPELPVAPPCGLSDRRQGRPPAGLDRHLHGFPSWPPPQRPGDGAEPPAPPPLLDGALLRECRDAVLRLGTWDALQALQQSGRLPAEQPAKGKDSGCRQWLITGLGGLDIGPQPGLAPTLGFAATAAAQDFFQHDLQASLQRLASLYDKGGVPFRAMAESPAFDGTASTLLAWSRHWAAVAAAAYADRLLNRADDRLPKAMAGLWDTARFKSLGGFRVLPTDNRSMHVDLWTDVVLAQVLCHDPARWQRAAAGQAWHRVSLPMHTLHQRDSEPDSQGRQRYVRGLGIEVLYQTVFIDRVAQWLHRPGPPAAARVDAPDSPSAPPSVTVHWAGLNQGQQINVQVVITPAGQDRSAPAASAPVFNPSASRRRSAPPALNLSLHQQRLIDQWRSRQAPASAALAPAVATALAAPQPARLSAAQLGWQAWAPSDAPAGSATHGVPPGHAVLGSARLWPWAGPGAAWLDLALLVEVQGAAPDPAQGPSGHAPIASSADRWVAVPMAWADPAGDNADAPDTSLCLVSLDDLAAAGLDIATLRAAAARPDGCSWVVHQAGMGAFLLLVLRLG